MREKLTVEQAAKLVSLNPYHFCKTFKKLTGRTFIEYVNVYRVKEAERLLLETDLNVTEPKSPVRWGAGIRIILPSCSSSTPGSYPHK
jgi:YesN/AraC family two-component response regulator